MKVHFIAIGGSAMHNLALALHDKGIVVTGSDDQIFDPSYSRLEKAGILPEEMGWFPDKIQNNLDAVILGMHARPDNPELAAAKSLGIQIYSYPEFLYQQTSNKKRVVIGGSHGKTSITSMILHVMNTLNLDCDFMVGAQLEGFTNMVKLTDHNDTTIFEGDEYLSSPIDRRPKFVHYKPHIGLLSGIAWDHINVFPTFDEYLDQFRLFIETIQEDGVLVYFEGDKHIRQIVKESSRNIKFIPYSSINSEIISGKTYLKTESGSTPIQVFGDHNMQNLAGAKVVLAELGVESVDFIEAISSFSGASRRLELLQEWDSGSIYKDFAHSPSKLKATVSAVKSQFPDRKLIACMELHTFSSLSEEFLKEYRGTLDNCDVPIVYFSPEAIAHKKLPPITTDMINSAFDRNDLIVIKDSEELKSFLRNQDLTNTSTLLMSSGNFGGINVEDLASELSPTESQS